jgi:hypothetical protein
MSETPKTLVKLGSKDAERMRRLKEEVQDRLARGFRECSKQPGR